ncbi:single-stranded DNA-binding protein [Flaviflexus salsibiostraticola]|uniref:Single-stranded DNA-binding protein n=1 Tax=Flaviflexus salsibiostraticola TaxID=1282737 RepID=A0A3Q8WUB9_9ACTO|nr:single-stranded DNA-binding protein [Flaviflexus salsibiostraticola]AZN30285.1 single-stranded DNA-binding protein [Flaviflexus salsibiostraticola]
MAGEPIITIVGNLTADPELRYVSSGIPVASFTVASTPRTLNKQTQQWEDGEPMFVRCSVWREHGENVANSLTKGTRVVVTGKLQVRSYEHEGQRRTSIEMQVDEIGPSLRYATAQVQKAQRSGGGGGGGFGGGGGGGYGGGNRGGSVSYDGPSGGSMNDPWADGPSGSKFDDAPPF